MEDSSIYRDLYAIWDQAQVWWAHVQPQLTSDFALRIYALTALAVLALASGWIAYSAKKILTQLKEAALDVKFPGPDPQKETSRAKRKAALETRAEDELEKFRPALWRLLGFGLVLPTLLFVVIAVSYDWFDPSGLPFLNLANKMPLQSINEATLAAFTANQFSHGAFFDVLEVFDYNITTIANNPHNYWFSGVVLIYRSIVSGFIVALTIGWGQFYLVKRSFKAKIRAEVERFNQIKPQIAASTPKPEDALAA